MAALLNKVKSFVITLSGTSQKNNQVQPIKPAKTITKKPTVTKSTTIVLPDEDEDDIIQELKKEVEFFQNELTDVKHDFEVYEIQAEQREDDLIKLVKQLRNKNKSLYAELHKSENKRLILENKYQDKKRRISELEYSEYKLQKHIESLPKEQQVVQHPPTQCTPTPPPPPPRQETQFKYVDKRTIVISMCDVDKSAICSESKSYEECWEALSIYEEVHGTIDGFVVPEHLRLY